MERLSNSIKQWLHIDSNVLLNQVLQLVLWSLFILILSWVLISTFNKTIQNNALRYRIKKTVRLTSYLLIFFLLIVTFTGNAKYFSISIGLASAGIAFALQEVLLSIAGWISIITSNLYKPGDRIELNGIKGDVIDISITKTTLMEIGDWIKSDNYNGRIVQISNSFVFKAALKNYSTDFPFVWEEINLPVKYGSNIEKAQQIILEAAQLELNDYATYAKEHWKGMVQKYMIEDANVEPTLTLKLTDNWVEFNLRFVVDYKKRRFTKDKLFRDIYKQIENSKGQVVLASATYEIVGFPEIKMTKDT